MYQIQNILNNPKQEFILAIPDSSETALLTLRYSSNSQCWYMDLTYDTTVVGSRQVCSSPNLLYQWKNVLPFGLGCYALDGSDPYYLDDFQTGRCGLLVLSAADVLAYVVYLGEEHDQT